MTQGDSLASCGSAGMKGKVLPLLECTAIDFSDSEISRGMEITESYNISVSIKALVLRIY